MTSRFTPLHRGGSGPPLVLLHGFTDTWRTWELVLPQLERHHDVLAPTLLGHAGGPPIEGGIDEDAIADAVEQAMDEAGFATAHFAGNSLGGYMALHIAARGRAESVVALAPAGGWAVGDGSYKETLDYFVEMKKLLKSIAPQADAIAATPDGRRRATAYITTSYEHIPPGLIAHLMVGAAACPAAGWGVGDGPCKETLNYLVEIKKLVKRFPPQADPIAGTREGRPRATAYITTSYEHIPPGLIAHLMVGAAACPAVEPLVERA